MINIINISIVIIIIIIILIRSISSTLIYDNLFLCIKSVRHLMNKNPVLCLFFVVVDVVADVVVAKYDDLNFMAKWI